MAEHQQQAPGQGQGQDAARRAQEAGRRAGERGRESADEMGRVAGQMAALGAETVGTWTELNQRVSQDMLRISAGTIEESARAVSEMQQATFAAVRDAQVAMFRWQSLWPEAFRDPVRFYQRSLQQVVSGFQESIDLSRRNTETAIRSFDRLQSHSEEAARTMDDTFKQGASKIRDIQSRTETLRVA